MRRLVLAAGAVALAAGCGSNAQTAKNPQPPGPTPHRVHRARVGTAITLAGEDDAGVAGRLRLAVRVRKVVSPAVGRGRYQQPRKGERFVAVRFTLKNLGDTLYHDSPTYGAEVVDAAGHGYDPTVADVTVGPGFPRVLRLRRGEARTGYIVFGVPKKARIVAVRYALNAGFAADLGEWRVR